SSVNMNSPSIFFHSTSADALHTRRSSDLQRSTEAVNHHGIAVVSHSWCANDDVLISHSAAALDTTSPSIVLKSSSAAAFDPTFPSIVLTSIYSTPFDLTSPSFVLNYNSAS